MSELVVCRDAEDLAERAARLISQAAAEAIAARGRFNLVAAGGSTPRATYQRLSSGDVPIDWARTWLFFGDERHVPHDDPRSNDHMVRESLLVHAAIPSGQVFPIATQRPVAECALDYAELLSWHFVLPAGEMPVFDLILLGLGDDGHTASLFPHALALDVDDMPVTSSPPGVLPPPVDRITLTYPVLNAARHVAFLVAGANKAEALRDVLSGRADFHDRPAAGVHPAQGRLTWLVDPAAASLLPKGSTS